MTDHGDHALTPGADLPQLIPSDVCLACEVCCRFPERENFLRPYFTGSEIEKAVAAGAPPEWFPDSRGSRIRLRPHPEGEGYICPFFETTSHHCSIYSVRPLDCRLYPLSLMRDEQGQALVLGLDLKCPYVQDTQNAPQLGALARQVTLQLQTAEMREVLSEHPEIVGPYQDDVTSECVVGPLSRLTSSS